MENKLNIEIKKINNKTKEIEWENTLEIPYQNEKNKSSIKSNNKLSKYNPFYQPNMNTIEFNDNKTTLIISLSKDNNEEITSKEKIEVLNNLLETKIISKKEYDKKINFFKLLKKKK